MTQQAGPTMLLAPPAPSFVPGQVGLNGHRHVRDPAQLGFGRNTSSTNSWELPPDFAKFIQEHSAPRQDSIQSAPRLNSLGDSFGLS
jgi:hypothetical protein